jgi:hypothetical protein
MTRFTGRVRRSRGIKSLVDVIKHNETARLVPHRDALGRLSDRHGLGSCSHGARPAVHPVTRRDPHRPRVGDVVNGLRVERCNKCSVEVHVP